MAYLGSIWRYARHALWILKTTKDRFINNETLRQRNLVISLVYISCYLPNACSFERCQASSLKSKRSEIRIHSRQQIMVFITSASVTNRTPLQSLPETAAPFRMIVLAQCAYFKHYYTSNISRDNHTVRRGYNRRFNSRQ